MSDTNDISFEEFVELCEEAGISTDNMDQMEQDFRAGKALADVTDALISDQETHAAPYTADEHMVAMDTAMALMSEDSTTEALKTQAIKLAVHAIRYLSECCHDEGQN